MGAVAAKELRYYGRDPRQRAGTLVWLLFAIALPVGVALSDLGERPEIVLAASALAALGGLASVNQYGFEGGAHWTNVVAGTDVRADLTGKNLALVVWVVGLVVVLPLVLAWGYVCWRTGLAYAVRWLEPRQPEFLDLLGLRRTG